MTQLENTTKILTQITELTSKDLLSWIYNGEYYGAKYGSIDLKVHITDDSSILTFINEDGFEVKCDLERYAYGLSLIKALHAYEKRRMDLTMNLEKIFNNVLGNVEMTDKKREMVNAVIGSMVNDMNDVLASRDPNSPSIAPPDNSMILGAYKTLKLRDKWSVYPAMKVESLHKDMPTSFMILPDEKLDSQIDKAIVNAIIVNLKPDLTVHIEWDFLYPGLKNTSDKKYICHITSKTHSAKITAKDREELMSVLNYVHDNGIPLSVIAKYTYFVRSIVYNKG